MVDQRTQHIELWFHSCLAFYEELAGVLLATLSF